MKPESAGLGLSQSTEFRLFLKGLFFTEHNRAVNNQAISEAIETLEAKAIFQGKKYSSNVRVGHDCGCIFLDLGNKHWQVIKIDRQRWIICDYQTIPIKFVRPGGMRELPMPVSKGRIADLRKLINISDDDWHILVAFIISCFQPQGAFPILFVHGEQGSAKSTASRMIRQLVDDNACPLRAKARDEDALMIAARNGAMVAIDNLSVIDDAFSDSLCRLVTGAGLSKRTLYSDLEETTLSVKKPVLINGIPELANRGDLLSRALIIHLPSISEGERKTEAEINEQFEQIRASCLSGILNAVVCALNNFDSVESSWLPRLADFYKWVLAAEPELGLEIGRFETVYQSRIHSANRQSIDQSLVGTALLDFIETYSDPWEGNCAALLSDLNRKLDPEAKFEYSKNKAWPKSPRALSSHLRRLAPDLRQLGLKIEFDIDGRRTLRLHSIEVNPNVLAEHP